MNEGCSTFYLCMYTCKFCIKKAQHYCNRTEIYCCIYSCFFFSKKKAIRVMAGCELFFIISFSILTLTVASWLLLGRMESRHTALPGPSLLENESLGESKIGREKAESISFPMSLDTKSVGLIIQVKLNE